MKNGFKELLISAAVGLGLGLLVLLSAAKGWIFLPLSPEKRPLFLFGTTLFSSLFRLLTLIRGEEGKPVNLQDG